MKKKYVHTTSKEIINNSIKVSAPLPQSSLQMKKYNTFDDNEKLNIINDLMTALDFPLEDGFAPNDLLNHLKTIKLEKYNQVLEKILQQHVDSFISTTNNLKQWRRKIKEWITSLFQPETRGGPIIKATEIECFKEKLIPILQDLSYRSFNLLKPKLLCLVKEMKNQENQPFNENACSKHFWYDFLKKNQDIKNIYKSLPEKRKIKKEAPNYQIEESGNEATKINYPSQTHLLADQSSPILFSSGSNYGLNSRNISLPDSNFNYWNDTEEMSPDNIPEAYFLQKDHLLIAQHRRDQTLLIVNHNESQSEDSKLDFCKPMFMAEEPEGEAEEPERDAYQKECYKHDFMLNNQFHRTPYKEQDPITPITDTYSLDLFPDKAPRKTAPQKWKLPFS